MSYSSVDDIFSAFDQLKVVVIGDVMVDSYIWGDVSRISPEAPVPIVRTRKREFRLGGAANVALNLKALGAEPILCATVGDDDEGEKFISRLADRGLSAEGIVKCNDRETTVKTRVLSGSQHILRVDSESEEYLSAESEQLLQEKIDALIVNSQVVVFEDYDKGTITPTIIANTVARAQEAGIPTVVDPKLRNFAQYKGVTLFKPNLKELREGLKIDVDIEDVSSVKSAASSLRENLGCAGTLVTLSEKGVYIDLEDQQHHIDAHLRSISDVSGAGDTVVSISALGLALKLSPKIIAALANLGGGLVCEHVGVVPIDKEQLKKEALQHIEL